MELGQQLGKSIHTLYFGQASDDEKLGKTNHRHTLNAAMGVDTWQTPLGSWCISYCFVVGLAGADGPRWHSVAPSGTERKHII